MLGRGAFGETFLARWQGREVAVKCVRVKSHDEATSFLREADALAALQHPNVMGYYGECTCSYCRLQDC